MKKTVSLIFILIFFLTFINVSLAFEKQNTKFSLEKLGISFSGYYKNLFTSSKTLNTEDNFYLDINRLRLAYKQTFTKNLSLQLTYDQEGLIHDIEHSAEMDLIRQKNQNDLAFLDLDHTASDKDHMYQRRSLYRAFIQYETDNLMATLGKQNIDWGRLRFYSPFDLFNPPSPSDLESDERLGFDALNIELTSDNFSGINFIFGPESNSSHTNFGLKLYKKIKTYDLFFIAAKVKKDRVAGLGFDGYIKDAGFRGEFTYTKKGKEKFPRFSLGIDYNFPNKIYVLAEYFYNGGANGDYDAFANSYAEQRNRLSIQKNLISLYMDYEITPLFKFSITNINDPKGQSVYVNPELRYNIMKNWDFAVGGQLFFESKGSEFENCNHTVYFKTKVFF